ncbi:MAG TPA: SRPBCC family protein [Thermoleophilia bacterium]|nr:SRPBCC family protein [Thermoleophilia bacterium]
MTHIHDSITINAPVDRVYALARNPRKWSTWWVGLSDPKKVKGDGSSGTEVEQDYLVAGFPFHIKNRVLDDRVDPDGTAHWRGVFEGKIHGEQKWDYVPSDDGGTLVNADIDYSLQSNAIGELLGRVADRLIIERMEERAIHQTLENLKFMVEH